MLDNDLLFFMTKILHTADLHLKKLDDERWKALQLILQQGTKHKIDALTIAGDLLDHDSYSVQLRENLRNLFSKQSFQIILLPGNHDAQSFNRGEYLGENVKIINSHLTSIMVNDTKIVGVPFSSIDSAQLSNLVEQLNTSLDPKQSNILLIHGELTDLFFDSADYGDEGNKRYMPFSLNLFAQTNLDYVLSGHYHSNSHIKRLANSRLEQGGFFLYPGSPVSITAKEINPRAAWLINTGQPPQEIPLETHYFHPIEIIFKPDSSPQILDELEKKLKQLPPNASGQLVVKGFFDQSLLNLTEEQLQQQLHDLVNKYRCQLNDQNFQVKDISSIISSSVYQAIMQKIQDATSDKKEAQQLIDTYTIALTN